jgi:phosphopantetheine adenylyltransferase
MSLAACYSSANTNMDRFLKKEFKLQRTSEVESELSEVLPRDAPGALTDELKELEREANEQLLASGEREALLLAVRKELRSSGWLKRLEAYCVKVVEKSNGQISSSDLVNEVLPVALRNVPKTVKETLQRDLHQALIKLIVEDKETG